MIGEMEGLLKKKNTNFGVENWLLDLSVGCFFFGGGGGGGGWGWGVFKARLVSSLGQTRLVSS